MPHRIVIQPKIMKRRRQGVTTECLMCPTAYPTSPPIIPKVGVAANQIFWRSGCSDRVYHCAVRTTKAGATALSNTPKKNRRAIKPAKLVAKVHPEDHNSPDKDSDAEELSSSKLVEKRS